MMKPSKALGIAAIVSIAVVFLFLTSAAAPAMSSNQANAFTTQSNVNLLPNPVLDSNVTWSVFHNGWKPLEYNNSKKNETLNAQLSTSFANPINVNESDISTPALHQALYGKTYFNNTLEWTPNQATFGLSFNGGTASIESGKNNGMTSISILGNSSKAGETGLEEYAMEIPLSDLPSTNLNYNYLTITGYNHIQKDVAGYSWEIRILNNSADGRILEAKNGTTRGTNNLITSVNEPFFYSFPITLMGEKNLTKASDIIISISNEFNSAVATNDIASITITGMSLTESPYNLGANSQTSTLNGTTGNAQLTVLSPNFPWTTITNNGYTAAVRQSLQNLTAQQSEISGNPSYVEQVTYEGNYYLPAAPDLTYLNSVISEKFNVSTVQTTVLDINGLSLLNVISGKNGTVTLTTANPNQKTTLIQIVDYTSSQWESVSGPPGFFSVNGILYYFDEIVLGIIAVVGLAGGAAVARTRSLRRVK